MRVLVDYRSPIGGVRLPEPSDPEPFDPESFDPEPLDNVALSDE